MEAVGNKSTTKDVPKTVGPTKNFEPAIPVSYASLLKN